MKILQEIGFDFWYRKVFMLLERDEILNMIKTCKFYKNNKVIHNILYVKLICNPCFITNELASYYLLYNYKDDSIRIYNNMLHNILFNNKMLNKKYKKLLTHYYKKKDSYDYKGRMLYKIY